MNKVKLPSEVVRAIETCHMADISDYGIVVLTSGSSKQVFPEFKRSPSVSKAIETLRRFTFSGMEDESDEGKVLERYNGADKLMNALVNGYEVELTQEERLKAIFLTEKDNKLAGSFQAEWIMNGILTAVNTLGIKIEGVND